MKFYFVIARCVNKDGTLSNRFNQYYFYENEKAKAEAFYQKKRAGEPNTLPYQLIECDIKTKEKDGFVWSRRKAPKRVKDIYNKNAGLD